MQSEYWVSCINCSKIYKTNDQRIQFCSKYCMNEWINGHNNPNGSIVVSYGQVDKKLYNKWKNQIKKLYNNQCVICKNNDIGLHSHHIVRWFNDLNLRYDVKNGILLCKECHSIVHGYSIGTKQNIFNDKQNISYVRKKYIKIAKIGFNE